MAKFSSENPPPSNRGRKKGSSPSDWLRRLSRTVIDFQNPLTGKPDKAPVSLVVAIQLILKATQDSDLPSIKEYFDRLDGKVVFKTEHSGLPGTGEVRVIVIRNGEQSDVGSEVAPVSGRISIQR